MERRVIGSASLAHGMTHTLELTFAALLARVGFEFGVDLAVLGSVATAGTFTFGATALPSGLITDRFGPRAVITWSLAAAGVCSLGVAAAPNVAGLAVMLALLGAAIGFYHPAGTAMVSTVSRRRGMAFAVHGIAGNAGVALAPAFATGIAIAFDWRMAYVALAGLAAASAVAVWRIAPPKEQTAQMALESNSVAPRTRAATAPPGERRWVAAPLVIIFAISIGTGFIYRGALTFMATHIERNLGLSFFGWAPATIAGAVTTIVLLFSFGGQVIGGMLSDRIPAERAAVPITLLSFPFLALAGIASGVPLLVALAGFVVMNFAQQPVINGLIADYAPAGRRGLAFGISFFMTFGVGSVAGAVSGYVADTAGTGANFVMLGGVGAVIAALTLVVAVGADRRRAGIATSQFGRTLPGAAADPAD